MRPDGADRSRWTAHELSTPGDCGPMMHECHVRALDAECEALRRDPSVIAALLQGSVARGDAHPGSDLDLLIVLADHEPPVFRHTFIDGVRVEQHRMSMPTLRARLDRRPGLAHDLVEARPLFDHAGVFPTLQKCAHRVLARYAPTAGERARLAYWIRTASEKVEAARECADWLRVSLIATTNAWPLIEALWAVNGLPAPSVGSVPTRVARLPRRPPGCRETFRRLLLGEVPERAAAFVGLAGWMAAALEAAPGDDDDPTGGRDTGRRD